MGAYTPDGENWLIGEPSYTEFFTFFNLSWGKREGVKEERPHAWIDQQICCSSTQGPGSGSRNVPGTQRGEEAAKDHTTPGMAWPG